MTLPQTQKQQTGFTLVEMAIVLIILGFLLAALLLPLQAQRDVSAQLETERLLDNAKKALLGFAQAQGRLPCPATNNGTGVFPDDTGTANPEGGGVCVVQTGFLPAKTLGLTPADSQGYALDAWDNRIRYGITTANASAFTSNDGMNTTGIANLTPDLCVSATASAITCPANTNLINNAVAVIYSLGATGTQGSGGIDENQNLITPTNNRFVSHTATGAGEPNGEFDHIVTWLSPYVLYNTMITAGQLH